MVDLSDSVAAVGDVHGCVAPLREALYRAGFIDERERWIGEDARLWFLGDLTDRGPDGIGVLDLVMSLQAQAADHGGEVGCLLGNHELMLLAAHLPEGRKLRLMQSGDDDVHALFRERWFGNGGQDADSSRLTDAHLEWIAKLPAMALINGHLLVHADTVGYLEFGESVEAVNESIAALLSDPVDVEEIDRLTHLMTKRFAFASDDGIAAREFLRTFGGRQLVHGHSPIPLLLGIEPHAVTGPLVYAGGYAVNLDTGLFLGGPCLVCGLPSVPKELP
ncbi:MAG TPA: metallophosphoesterase family protein [Actinocrinis sp.]|uniref:metallophosphoesterase family protein n=1 Tax=Actinocrinis sp. TaxID=1920516 RepID=UPI002D236F73|nr:metallophosphoesterase family protein [Actinocrinis sp.]HZU56530.1 metallophosphoesterase family protein [Actinocrinis sp.]